MTNPMGADDILINSLDLSRRAHNCLRGAKFKTVGDLLRSSKWELANIRGFGKHSMEEVAAKVAEAGFVLPRDGYEKIDAQAKLAKAPDYPLTKREYFAGMAMQGLLANEAMVQRLKRKLRPILRDVRHTNIGDLNVIVFAAVCYAEDLINELNK